MKDSYYSRKILELTRMQVSDSDQLLIDEAMKAYVKGDYQRIDEIIVRISPDYKLLESLVQKLRGKSVYTGLRKLIEGKDQTTEQAIVTVASLMVHSALELKENRIEYRKLLPELHKKLGVLISKL